MMRRSLSIGASRGPLEPQQSPTRSRSNSKIFDQAVPTGTFLPATPRSGNSSPNITPRVYPVDKEGKESLSKRKMHLDILNAIEESETNLRESLVDLATRTATELRAINQRQSVILNAIIDTNHGKHILTNEKGQYMGSVGTMDEEDEEGEGCCSCWGKRKKYKAFV